MEHKCVMCGAVLEKKRPNRFYCSEKCRQKAIYARRTKQARQAFCADCGREISISLASKRQYCPKCEVARRECGCRSHGAALCWSCVRCGPLRCSWVRSNGRERAADMEIDWRGVSGGVSVGVVVGCGRYIEEVKS